MCDRRTAASGDAVANKRLCFPRIATSIRYDRERTDNGQQVIQLGEPRFRLTFYQVKTIVHEGFMLIDTLINVGETSGDRRANCRKINVNRI